MQYDFSVPAGGSQVIDVKGRFFKYKSGTGAIRVKATSGGYVDLLPGQGVWNVEFTQLIVQDRSGAANVGVLLAGAFDFNDDRISGTVDVVDGGKARSMNGQACVMYGWRGGVASQYANVQLFNPVGSGKRAFIEQINMFSKGALTDGITIVRKMEPLADLIGKGIKKNILASISSDSAIEMRSEVTATRFDATSRIIFGLDKSTKIYKFTEPLQLEPGSGIALYGFAAGDDIGAGFEYFEEPL